MRNTRASTKNDGVSKPQAPKKPLLTQSAAQSAKRKRSNASTSSKPKGTKAKASTVQNQGETSEPSNNVDNAFGIEFGDVRQKERFDKLVGRTIVSTRYMDSNVISTLGLKEDFEFMVDNVGWSYFLSLTYPTYERLTLEFLSSVKVEVLNGPKEGRITFRLFNKEFCFTLAEFNAIYKFPIGGERNATLERDFMAKLFWIQITPNWDYDSSNSKATSIPNPCFRYMHRVMAHTLFARGGSDGSVRRDELYFLWCMATKKGNVDSGSYLARHLAKVGRASKGVIAIGGLITPIAIHLGFQRNVSNLTEVKGNDRVDLQSCIQMEMISKVNDVYYLGKDRFATGIVLPDEDRRWVRDERNWKLEERESGSSPTPLLCLPPPPPPCGTTMESLMEKVLRELESQRVFMEKINANVERLDARVEDIARHAGLPPR